jgi:tetratricopeptide (TPR) repeat protein
MNRQQTILISVFITLFFVMYFACDYVPKNHQKLEAQRELSKQGIGADKLIETAKAQLNAEQKSEIAILEQNLKTAASDTAKIQLLKKLSGEWYRLQQFAASGSYAEQVAEKENTEMAWMIAGAMYQQAIAQSQDETLRQDCTDKAVKAFENALSINPKNIENQINLALCYTQNPPKDNPMKGILMLRELDSKNPNNPKILFQLAQLAMKTNQFAKAIERLEQILSIAPDSPDAICLIADAYQGNGEAAKAASFAKKCTALLKK